MFNLRPIYALIATFACLLALDLIVAAASAQSEPLKAEGCSDGPISLIAENVIVDKKIYTCGKTIKLFADTVEFRPGGLLHSGYPSPRKYSCWTQPVGYQAGQIIIVARRINSINVKATGQTGGDRRAVT